VAAEFDELEDEENVTERQTDVPLLEIYSPIREPWSGKVVAVAEFYEAAGDLQATLAAAWRRSWLVVAAVTLCIMGLLFGIVLRGSGLIASQRRALEERVTELSALLRQNEDLRLGVQQASRRTATLNEQFLRRISADLHDGPAQLLALASLRLGHDGPAQDAAARPGELAAIRSFLDDAMLEIRSICRGLVLPQIDAMDLKEVVASAVAAHEQRTGTTVEFSVEGMASRLWQPEKICVFRFVQEGLHNAFRHAAGAGQAVAVVASAGLFRVTVSDTGPGLAMDRPEGLGLAGLRERVASLGGRFSIESSPAGTVLTMILMLDDRRAD
jgi:signal transduction histidine kinase